MGNSNQRLKDSYDILYTNSNNVIHQQSDRIINLMNDNNNLSLINKGLLNDNWKLKKKLWLIEDNNINDSLKTKTVSELMLLQEKKIEELNIVLKREKNSMDYLYNYNNNPKNNTNDIFTESIFVEDNQELSEVDNKKIKEMLDVVIKAQKDPLNLDTFE